MLNNQKQCTKCNEIKYFSEFSKEKDTKDGFRSKCKVCRNIETKERQKTKIGLVSKIYSSQRNNSRRRNHSVPSYSNKELSHWIFDQDLFYILYNEWVDSGYKKEKSPSVDRIDDFKGYSFDNIQLMTWGENKDKGHKDCKDGIGTCGERCKAVLQYDMKMNFISEYYSTHDALRKTGINQGNISAVCLNKRPHAGGFIWRHKA